MAEQKTKKTLSSHIGSGRININSIEIQEWSSLESSSYENWDEIEMLFGHLVIGNLQIAICNQ